MYLDGHFQFHPGTVLQFQVRLETSEEGGRAHEAVVWGKGQLLGRRPGPIAGSGIRPPVCLMLWLLCVAIGSYVAVGKF